MRLLLQATFAVTCMLYMASIYKKAWKLYILKQQGFDLMNFDDNTCK